MQQGNASIRPSGGRLAGWRVAPRAALLVAALLVPQAAFPISLSQLLHMPLEQLLRLQISAPSPAPRPQQRQSEASDGLPGGGVA